MRNFTKKIIIGGLISLPMISSAQFAVIPGGDGRTNPAIRSIGIGTFTVVNRPQANLHVSQLLMPNSPFFAVGNLFRTDGSNTVANQWQLFTGATANSVTEKFRLYVPANDSTITLQATTSDLIFADNKNQITLQQIIKMQQQIALLEKKIAQLEQVLAEK
jgi:hypothetical protein